MSTVYHIRPNNYTKIIRYRQSPKADTEFTVSVFHSGTRLSEINDLPNIAYRLFDDVADTTPVFVRLDIKNPHWYDPDRYTTLKHTLADLLIQQDIDIGPSEYPNGLLEYIQATPKAITLDIPSGIIYYQRGFYKWTFKPLSHFDNLPVNSPRLRRLFALQSVVVKIAGKQYVLVDDTSSAWSSFLATSYPKWFANKHEYLKALGKAFTTDVKGTALEGVSFTS